MAQFCDVCEYVMQYDVKPDMFQLVCTSCKQTKVPQSSVLFTSEDDDKFTQNVSKVYGDSTVQRWHEKCASCGEQYYLFYQKQNKDVLFICKCSQQQLRQTSRGRPKVYTQKQYIDRFNKQFSRVDEQQSGYYDPLPLMK